MIKGKVKESKKQENIPSSYIEVHTTPDMKKDAQIRADKIPPDIKNSILKGKGRFCGAIGEMAFIKISEGIESTDRSVYHFDVITPKGLFEVKTKERGDWPKLNYACSVADANVKQKCDYYVFASTITGYSKVWILGYLSREDFKKLSVFRKKGDYDSDNSQICTADCWNVRIDQLRNIKEIL